MIKFVINPEYSHLSDFIEGMPFTFPDTGETIYQERNEIKVFETESGRIVAKSFRIPHIINRIVYSFIRPSKAKRSYSYSLEILRRGFNTPRPVAYIEMFGTGLLAQSFYISTCSDGVTMRQFNYAEVLTDEDVVILKAFARFTAMLHEKEIYHADYSPGNILYKKTNGTIVFDLIDVNRMKFVKVTMKMAMKAFRRLEFPTETLEIIVNEYAAARLNINKSL